MSSSNLIDLTTLTWNLPLNFDVAFCNWLDKFLPPTEADQEKTSFVTSQGLFCYKVMPFGLKNARATYQRLVNHMFRPQFFL